MDKQEECLDKMSEEIALIINNLIINNLKNLKNEFEKISDSIKQITNVFDGIPENIEYAKQIAILEQKRKKTKNYLELKMIDRQLNKLKYGKRKG